MAKGKRKAAPGDVATNRQARHRYHLLETWEAEGRVRAGERQGRRRQAPGDQGAGVETGDGTGGSPLRTPSEALPSPVSGTKTTRRRKGWVLLSGMVLLRWVVRRTSYYIVR